MVPRMYLKGCSYYSKIIGKSIELKDTKTHQVIRLWGWIDTSYLCKFNWKKIHNFILMKYFPSVILSNLGSNFNISIVPSRFWLYEKNMGNLGVFLTYLFISKNMYFYVYEKTVESWCLALKEYISKSSVCKYPHKFTHIHIMIIKNTEDKFSSHWNQNLTFNIGFHMNYNSSEIKVGVKYGRKEGRNEGRKVGRKGWREGGKKGKS